MPEIDCKFCNNLNIDPKDRYHPNSSGEQDNRKPWCLPPDVIKSPRDIAPMLDRNRPFIVVGSSNLCGSIACKTPKNVIHLADLFCHHSGPNVRLPNIDIDNERIRDVKSWSKARNIIVTTARKLKKFPEEEDILVDPQCRVKPVQQSRENAPAKSKKKEDEDEEGEEEEEECEDNNAADEEQAKRLMDLKDIRCLWIAFQVAQGQVIESPLWWKKRKRKPVPTYDQVIVATGPADIGLHVDAYQRKIAVDTYLSCVIGRKAVILIPPSPAATEFFKKNRTTSFPTPKEDEGLQILQKIKELKGYCFILGAPREDEESEEEEEEEEEEETTKKEEEDEDEDEDEDDDAEATTDGCMALFIPRKWYHWILNISQFSVVFSESHF